MKNWQKDRNYRKYENADGSFKYVITTNGKAIEVSEDVYKVYAASERKMEYMELDLKRDRVLQDRNGRAVLDENGLPVLLPEREVSLDKLIGEDWDYPSSAPSPEDMLVGQYEIETLHNCLDLLDADERALIDALFFEGLTEREYALRINVTQKTVNNRKQRILKKIKNNF